MEPQRVSGILLIAGILFLIFGGIVAPPGFYREQALDGRLRIIDAYPSRWVANNILGFLGVLSTATGFLALTIHFWDSQSRPLIVAGAASFALAGISMSILSYLRTTAPAANLAGISPLDYAWIGLTMAGVLIYGIVFLQAGYPAWLGYLSIASALLLPVGSVLISFTVAEFIYLVTLVMGIVLLLRT